MADLRVRSLQPERQDDLCGDLQTPLGKLEADLAVAGAELFAPAECEGGQGVHGASLFGIGER